MKEELEDKEKEVKTGWGKNARKTALKPGDKIF